MFYTLTISYNYDPARMNASAYSLKNPGLIDVGVGARSFTCTQQQREGNDQEGTDGDDAAARHRSKAGFWNREV